jgi:hypothetical protein
MSSPTPPGVPLPNPGVAAQKTNPLVWILGGIAVLLFGGMLTCGIVGFLAVRAVKNAGFDPDLMKRNPGLAMAKMAAAVNPDLQTVSTNERTGAITMREKSTGKIVTFKFDMEKKSLVVVGDDGKEVTFNAIGEGKNGAVTVQSSEGTMRIGAAAGNTAPAWVPVYPGSSPEGTMATQSKDGSSNTFTFKTNDAASKVLTYYQDQLKSAGFKLNLVSSGDQGGMVQAEDSGKKRTIIVTVGSSAEGTQASVMAVEK